MCMSQFNILYAFNLTFCVGLYASPSYMSTIMSYNLCSICIHCKRNFHYKESIPVNWEYVEQTINPIMKLKPLESFRVQVKK